MWTRAWFRVLVPSVAAAALVGCTDTPTPAAAKGDGSGGVNVQPTGGGGSGASGGGNVITASGTGGAATADASAGLPRPTDLDAAAPEDTGVGGASTDGGPLFAGPFTCTEVIGMKTTDEWYMAGFTDALGPELAKRWQGRFAHYGYTTEFAKPDSWAWGPKSTTTPQELILTPPCAQGGSAPDRIIFQAWDYELTTDQEWEGSLEAALATVRAKRPSARRIDLMTIIRCPMNGWCHSDHPQPVPGADHMTSKMDCHIPESVDAVFAKVAANHPGLVGLSPKFEAHACAATINANHLGDQNIPVAKDIAAYYKTMP